MANHMKRTNCVYIDSETCGLHSMMVLLQYAEDDGPIELYNVWKEPVWKTLKLLEWIATKTVIGFNNVFDWFHVNKTHTIWSLLPSDWIPEEHIEEIAMIEPKGMYQDVLKPVNAMDLLLFSRKGPMQSLMAREDVRIRRVPTALAYALAEELERRIQLDGIYFARSKDKEAPRWKVYDVKNRAGDVDQHFKDVVLKFNAAGGLKFLAEHILGYAPKFHFKDVEIDRSLFPKEIGYAPYALAVANPEDGWAVYKTDKKGQQVVAGHAWPAVIKHHIEHWATNENAREYAKDDIVYTRALDKHFGYPEPGDDDSVLACMVPIVRWRGMKINVDGIQDLLQQARAVVAASPVNINKPSAVRAYIGECMCDTELVILETSTKKANIESIKNWEITENQEDDTGAEGLQAWSIDHNEVCVKCFGTGEGDLGEKCARCEGTAELKPGLHPASKRAAEILTVKAAAKEVELYEKLLKAGRFHPSFNVIGTLSSRMSGGDGLNAQGIKHDKDVRMMFPLSDDGYTLSGGDFDSFEVTLADAVYNDPGIRDILCSGQKIHAYFAMEMYPPATYDEVMQSDGGKDINKNKCLDMYVRGKSGVFGMIYGGDWNTLVKNFGIPREVAQAAEMGFFKRFPGIPEARQRVVDWFCSMKQQPNGHVVWQDPREYVESFLGFRRYFTLENQICKALFELANEPPKHWRDSKVKVVRRDRVQSASGAVMSALFGAAFAMQAANTRAAANHEIQSPGAQITKKAQRRIWDLQPAGVGKLLVIPFNCHDEIMCPTVPHMVDHVAEVVTEVVESYREKVPMIGLTWFKKMANWAGKKGGEVEGQVKVQSPLMKMTEKPIQPACSV